MPIQIIRGILQPCDTRRLIKTSCDWSKMAIYRLIIAVVVVVLTILFKQLLENKAVLKVL